MLKKVRGFTLIEFLIYISLVGVIITIAGAVALNIFYGKAKLKTIEEISYNARFALGKISTSIKNAESINSPNMGNSGEELSLELKDASQNPILFDLYAGTVRVKRGAGDFVDLTSDEVIVSELQFYNLSNDNTAETIRIKMKIKFKNPSNRPEYNFEKTFFTTVNLRNK